MAFSKSAQKAIDAFQGFPERQRRTAPFSPYYPTRIPHHWKRKDPDGDSHPFPMDSLMEVICERHNIGRETPEQVLMANWRKLLGDDHAFRCSPVRLDPHGTLFIACNNPTLRRELSFQARNLVQRIQQLPACEHVTRVVFRAQ